MNRVKVGFFSISHPSPTGDDRPYLEWHQLDHMPEQYQLPGLVFAQRWAATPACRAVRVAGTEGWAMVDHVVCYLMGSPVDQTIDDFFTLGRHLAELGRFAGALPAQYVGALRLLETHAAPRALVSAEVVPFRPNRGIYLVVEEPVEGTEHERPRRVPAAAACRDAPGARLGAGGGRRVGVRDHARDPPPAFQRGSVPDDGLLPRRRARRRRRAACRVRRARMGRCSRASRAGRALRVDDVLGVGPLRVVVDGDSGRLPQATVPLFSLFWLFSFFFSRNRFSEWTIEASINRSLSFEMKW